MSPVTKVLLIGLLAVVPACAANTDSSDDPASTDADLSAGALTDAQLATALSKTPAKMSATRAKQLVAATLNPVATTARLKLLNDFVGARVADPQKYSGDTYGTLAAAMEAIVWDTPRDLVSTPAGFGGQHFTTTAPFNGKDYYSDGTSLRVSGVASRDYKLELTVGGYHLTIDRVPAGSTAKDTAKLIGDALDAKNQDISDSLGDTFDKYFGGDHADAQSGWDDVEITTTNDTVQILTSLNGG